MKKHKDEKEQIINLYSNFVNQPVLMQPKMLEAWLSKLEMMMNVEDFMLFFNDGEIPDEAELSVINGVGVIPVFGPTTNYPKDDIMVRLGIIASYPLIKEQYTEAMEREDVHAVAFHIDSPGGMGSGLFDLMEYLSSRRDEKPVYSMVDEDAFSAAYGIASTAGADNIYVTRSGMVGSIGSIIMHRDMSKYLEDHGVKYEAFTYGKKKAQFASFAPLSDEAKAEYQEMVNEHGKEFTELTAKNLGVSFSSIKNLEAGIFTAKKGIETGLASRIVSFSDAMMEIGTNNLQEGKEVTDKMNLAELKEKHPEAYTELKSEMLAEMPVPKVEAKEDPRIPELQAKVEEQGKVIESQGKQLKEYEKKDAIRHQKEIAQTVDSVWKTHLEDSSIPATLYAKIRKQVNYQDFVSEDGNLKVEEFSKAVQDEVKDWEGLSAESTIQGFGTKPPADGDKIKDEAEERATGLCAAAGQKS